MNFNWDYSDCRLVSLDGFLTIPSSINGVPVNRQAVANELIADGKKGKMPSA